MLVQGVWGNSYIPEDCVGRMVYSKSWGYGIIIRKESKDYLAFFEKCTEHAKYDFPPHFAKVDFNTMILFPHMGEMIITDRDKEVYIRMDYITKNMASPFWSPYWTVIVNSGIRAFYKFIPPESSININITVDGKSVKPSFFSEETWANFRNLK